MYIKDFLKETERMFDQQIIKIKGKETQGVGFKIEGPWYFLYATDSENITLGDIRCWDKKTSKNVETSIRVDIFNNQAFSSVESLWDDGNFIILNPKFLQT